MQQIHLITYYATIVQKDNAFPLKKKTTRGRINQKLIKLDIYSGWEEKGELDTVRARVPLVKFLT